MHSGLQMRGIIHRSLDLTFFSQHGIITDLIAYLLDGKCVGIVGVSGGSRGI